MGTHIKMVSVKSVFLFAFLIQLSVGRKHHLQIRDDERRYIPLSTFGFYQGGILDVSLTDFRLDASIVADPNRDAIGFSIDKTRIDSLNPYLDNHQQTCLLREDAFSQQYGPILFMKMNLEDKRMDVSCSEDWQVFQIYNNRSAISSYSRNKRESENKVEKIDSICSQINIPLDIAKRDGQYYVNMTFVMLIANIEEIGLYNFYLHACPNYMVYEYNSRLNFLHMNFDMDIIESNRGNFLSAGEMPLPSLYFMMSLLFFFTGLFWVFVLKKTSHTVYKIHYIMAVLVFLKSLSLLFHSINYHFIQVKGEHVEAWAILFYITHLLKGAVLFITIVLIGTGWTFIKHILSDKDKKIFMIVIPLQVLANVAKIIFDESEEGDIEHNTWRDIFTLVDLLCCGAILFPVVWSIKHLQEASATDGKAAINLRKLKLFRQFYIMVVCYIYFTRIIVYLLKTTVAFQFVWLDEMFREMATYIFFILTGYKFRPVNANPYFTVSNSDDEDDEVEILTQSDLAGSTVNRHKRPSQAVKMQSRTLPVDPLDEYEGEIDEKEKLIGKRESSHEYD